MVGGHFLSTPPRKRKRSTIKSALIQVTNFDPPVFSSSTGLPLDSVRLEPDRPYTVGRSRLACDFLVKNRKVSRRHCQFLYDSENRKIYVLDGVIQSQSSCSSSVVDEFRRRLLCADVVEKENGSGDFCETKGSLNGVFVNGVRIRSGRVQELFVGDEVLLAFGSELSCSLRMQIGTIGFVIQGIIFEEKVVSVSDEMEAGRNPSFGASGFSQGSVSRGKRSKRVFALEANDITSPVIEFRAPKHFDIRERMDFFISHCRHILRSDDPILCIRRCAFSDSGKESRCGYSIKVVPQAGNPHSLPVRDNFMNVDPEFRTTIVSSRQGASDLHQTRVTSKTIVSLKPTDESAADAAPQDYIDQTDGASLGNDNEVASDKKQTPFFNSGSGEIPAPVDCVNKNKRSQSPTRPSGKKFYLNRLQYSEHSLFGHDTVSLPELLHPVESILQIFIATFTCDILWFFSYCEIPSHLPVTIACHNGERCWSSSHDARIATPYPQFPNLVIVFPPFPEAIAFGNDRKKQGVACHHPKLLILQRENSVRVIITSANLVDSQWNRVSNTVWWQEFPRRKQPEYLSLFPQHPGEKRSQGFRSDFGAQLAGFVASLVIDVPSQAHWIIELTKYDFKGATGHLVASVPGVHSNNLLEPFNSKPILGCVEASVVGLSHLFRTTADSKGIELKKLACFLASSQANSFGMVEIVLRRNTNVPADANAVSIFVSNPNDSSSSGGVQLGFLPRKVAKWVSPLWDIGFFKFAGFVYRDEALRAAFGRNNYKVRLILHVSQGSSFSDISKIIRPPHVVALSFLVASLKRCIGLQRLQEILSRYRWPESQESDFIYSASSVGSSINAGFLAAFSAAAGKKTLQHFDSQESDPEWGCWNPSQERKAPSIRLVFPTIDRVKKACGGLLPSRRILCFSEKTWLKLREYNMLHDAIPSPANRVGYPMHVKVARRRFLSPRDGSSFGWVYCGSHNFSAAAWGRPVSNPSRNSENSPPNTATSSGSRLHICNYELGIIFVVPPPEATDTANKNIEHLDDIELPFAIPPPKYGPQDRPATGLAMREALAELTKQIGSVTEAEHLENMMDEIPEEDDEVFEARDCVAVEEEEERAYAETLWCQVDSSMSS